MSNKILIDFRRIADNTGISSYLKMILKAINEDDNVYFLLLNEKDKNFEFSKYVNTDKIKLIFCSSKPFSLKSNIEIPMLINKYKIRLFHSTHFDIPLGIIFCPNCNLVSTIHDIIPLKYSQYYKTSIIKYLYFILMYNACAILSKKIITVSNYSKADLINYLHVKKDKISVIYNSYDLKNLELKTAKNKGLGLIKLFFVGTNFEHKNINEVIKAVKILKDRGYNILFNIAGAERAYTNILQNTIKELQLNENVKILGKVSDEDLDKLYKISDIYVFPSLVEGFGIPLLEAMNYELPIVSSNKTCLPEIVGAAGILIDPTAKNFAEKIEFLINNPKKVENLVARGRERITDFSQDKFNSLMLSLYKEVML